MPYNIDVNINFGSASANFQQLIDNNAKLQATIDSLSKTIQEFGNRTKKSTSEGIKGIGDYAGSYKNLSKEIAQSRKQLIEELSTLDKLKRARGTDKAAIDEQVASINKLQREIKEQTQIQAQYNKTLGITAATARTTNTALGTLKKTFNSLGAVLGISFGAYGAFRAITESIKTIADFNLAQKKLQSILGETAQGMKVVEQSAIDVGRASIFGAKGVTELQVELAKMGFAKQEIIAMQGAIVNLATATQEELAPSAEVVANILRAFQLPAEEATRVVDVMGKAFNDSALDLSNFREAIKYVAPVAKQAGFSLEQTVAALELLSQVGIKGSLAGTGLNNVLKAMMDGNSKLSKALGGTVQGYEGFISVLKKARDEGWDSEKIFGLITQRATAAFTVFKEGVDDLDNFKISLENASGVIKGQAAVQLESITYKAKLAKESFNAMILGMDSGTGVLSTAIKDILGLFTQLTSKSESIGDSFLDQRKSVGDLVINIQPLIDRYAQLTNNLDPLFKKTDLTKTQQEELSVIITKVAEAIPGTVSAFDAYGNALDINAIKAQEFIDTQISIMKILNRTAIQEAEDILLKLGGKLNSARKVYESIIKTGEITVTTGQSVNVRKATQQEIADAQEKFNALAIEYRDYQNYIKSLNGDALKEEIAFRKRMQSVDEEFGKKEADPFDADAAKKAQQDRLKLEIEYLELRKKNTEEYIKLQNDGYIEEQKLAENDLAFSKQILDKKLELEIVSGTDVVSARKANKLEIENVELKYASAMQAIAAKMVDDLIKEEERLAKSDEKVGDDIASNMAKKIKAALKIIEDENEKIEKANAFKKQNPIWSALGFTSDDTEAIDAIKEGFDKAVEYITGWADKWVEQTERVVDARNNLVDEAEQALQTELQLAELGFASNVTLKRKELAESKKLREEALAEARKARKAQAQLETAEQAGQLVTAAANILKSMSGLGPVGIAIGVATIAAMLASFVIFRKKAMAAASTDKYEKGGEVGGRRHSQGGTHIEAEQGEYVVNRRSTLKHKKLIEAINNDDNISLNKLYINGLKSSVLSAHVSLDDSEDLKAIRKALETKDKQVSYFGNYRIEKSGNITTRIRMN